MSSNLVLRFKPFDPYHYNDVSYSPPRIASHQTLRARGLVSQPKKSRDNVFIPDPSFSMRFLIGDSYTFDIFRIRHTNFSRGCVVALSSR